MVFYILFFVGIASLCTARHVPHESPNLRIIGGKEATPHSAPYMVFYKVNDPKGGAFECGGSLITPSHVLTAAHCLRDKRTIKYLLLGAHNLAKKEPTQQKVLAADYVIHQDFDKPQGVNDIAIIKLKSPVTLNSNVGIVKLPTEKDAKNTYVGQVATAYGWGKIHDVPKVVGTDVLRTVDLKVIANSDCLKLAPNKNVFDDDMCTDGNGPKGACHGDSGGPLVSNGLQIGVMSRLVTDYCEKNLPTVYTKVAYHAKWIATTLKKL